MRRITRALAAIVALSLGAALAEDATSDRIAELVAALGSRYYDEREEAKKALAAIGAPAEEALLAAVGSDDFRVRVSAIELLGKGRCGKAVPRLVEVLGDADEEVARQAAAALHAIGGEGRAAVERRRREDKAFAERTAELVRVWLESDVEEALDPLMTSTDGWGFYEGQYRKVVALGPDAAPVLLAMFTDPTYEFHTVPAERPRRQAIMRILAGEALAEFPDGPFAGRLRDALDGKIPEAREVWDDDPDQFEEAAAYALWTHGETKWLEGLEKRWRDQLSQGVRGVRDHLAFVVIRQQRYEEAVNIYRADIAESRDDYPSIFNLATVYGKLGRKDLALSTLKDAVKAGYHNGEWLRREGYFECLRGDPEFEAIQKQLEGEEETPE